MTKENPPSLNFTGSRNSASIPWPGTRRRRFRALMLIFTAAICLKRSRTAIIAEWELGVQLVPEEDEHKFDFDLLDATKLVPEELVPVRIVGRLVLNRNPTIFSRRPNRSPFCRRTSFRVLIFPTIRCLQGRLHSYLDTQISASRRTKFSRDSDQSSGCTDS